MTAQPRLIRQITRGRLLGWAAVTVAGFWPLALLERAAGVNGRPADQAWIIPIGLVGGIAIWGAYRRLAPNRGRAQMIVTPDRLDFRDSGASDAVVERSRIGLVDVLGSPLSGQYVLTVYDHQSAVIAVWLPRWAGRNEQRIVGVMRSAGYPAARHRDVYDGRFQSQTAGQPPQMVR